MKVNRQELLAILNKIKPGLSQKSIIEQAQHFIFTKSHIVTYNDNIAICYPFKTDFQFTVIANEFFKLLDSINHDEIDMSLENEILLIKSKSRKIKIKSLGKVKDVEQYLTALDYYDLDKFEWKKLSDNFLTAIKHCVFSASRDMSNLALTGIYINKKYVFSTDGLRISKHNLSKKIDKILLPVNSAESLIGFDINRYFIKDAWIFFVDKNNVIFCSKKLNEKYPYSDLNKNFDFDGIEIELPEDFIDSVSSAEILAEGEFNIDKTVIVKIKDSKIYCIGSNDIGEVKTWNKIKCKKDLSFVINPIFLKDILKITNKIKIGSDRVMFQHDNFKHLISIGLSENNEK